MTTVSQPEAAEVTDQGRLQLALNVSDLDAAIEFYSKLFDAQPAKLRPGYANFAISSPPLKLVLIEGERGGTINHLGVEVASTEAVAAADVRVRSRGLSTIEESGVACCYAVQDKIWAKGPDGEDWEVYTVLGDSNQMSSSTQDCGPGCC